MKSIHRPTLLTSVIVIVVVVVAYHVLVGRKK